MTRPSSLPALLLAAGISLCLTGSARCESDPARRELVLPGASGMPEAAAGADEPWRSQARSEAEAGRDSRALMPYTLEQVQRIQGLERAQRRARAFARPVPRQGVRSIALALEAARPVPVIRAAQGYVTALVFLDLTGAPWPVSRVLMRPAFRVADDAADAAGQARHIVYIAPQGAFDHGNVTVELAGLDLPVSLAVLVDDGEPADFRVAIRVPLPGPGADPRAFGRPGRFHAGDPLLALFGTGEPPAGARRLTVTGGDARDRAWRYQDHLYLKTPAPLLAPGPLGLERGPDGDWIYELVDTPFAVINRDGVRLRLRLSDPVHTVPVATARRERP